MKAFCPYLFDSKVEILSLALICIKRAVVLVNLGEEEEPCYCVEVGLLGPEVEIGEQLSGGLCG